MRWVPPPPSEPTKSDAELAAERRDKVHALQQAGLLRSPRIAQAMMTVRREDFVPRLHRDHAYEEVPLPLPGEQATISCPHSYPLFYEPLGLDEGHRFLEVGVGSGYGTALAREIVGDRGRVVAIEIDAVTLAYAAANLGRAGYHDVALVQGDGGLGVPARAPFDRICVTAACPDVPGPLVEQLVDGGRLILPVERDAVQELVLVDKRDGEVTRRTLTEVGYVPMRGRFAGRSE